jgi:hypothetical protein
VHAEAAACRNNLKKYAALLVKSNDSIFGYPPEVQSGDDESNIPFPPEHTWSTTQEKIADLLDEGKYLNGPLDSAVSY